MKGIWKIPIGVIGKVILSFYSTYKWNCLHPFTKGYRWIVVGGIPGVRKFKAISFFFSDDSEWQMTTSRETNSAHQQKQQQTWIKPAIGRILWHFSECLCILLLCENESIAPKVHRRHRQTNGITSRKKIKKEMKNKKILNGRQSKPECQHVSKEPMELKRQV